MTTATTKQKLKDLMRFRNTEYQALTLYQIAHEIYSDIIEEHVEHYTQMFYQKKTGHLRNLMREIRKTDDEFRWLCVLPPDKTNKVDNSGRRIRPYVEYRYLNIIASKNTRVLIRSE